MPPLPLTPQVLRCAFQGSVGSRKWTNVIHYSYTGGPPDITDLGDLATNLGDEWGTNMSSLQDTSTSLVSIAIADLTGPLYAAVDSPQPQAGTREGDFLPAGTCFLVVYPISRRYRGGHPRQYLSVGTFADTETPQTWASAFVADVGEPWVGTIAAPITNTYGTTLITSVGCVSYTLDRVTRATGFYEAFDLGDVLFSDTFASQRRRARKGARHR